MTKCGMSLRRPIVAAVAAVLCLPGCAVDPKTGAQSIAGIKVSDDPCAPTGAVVGGVLGGIAGAVVGNQISHRRGTQGVSIAVGATVGALIGRDIDRRRCELFKIAKKHNVEIEVAEVAVPTGQLPPPEALQASVDSESTQVQESTPTQVAGPKANEQQSRRNTERSVAGLSVTVRDSGRQFDTGSEQLNPQVRAYFAEVAEQYSYAKQAQKLGASTPREDRAAVESLRTKRILLVGHTDDVGSSRGNADLSERRAMAVARVFREQGIPDSQIFYQGAGESLPIGDNRTDEGRSKNRRVEIVDVTDDASFHKFLATRQPKIEYYRPAPPTFVDVAAKPTSSGPIAQPQPTFVDVPAKPTTPAPIAQSQTTAKAPLAPARNTTTRPSAAAPAATPATSPSANVAIISRLIDFGGAPASTVVAAADFGKEITPKADFSLISSAQASGGPVVPACSSDRPRLANGVKSLRDQKDISITEYMPGLYNSSWMDTVNGNLVGLSNVAVYRDGGSPANKPNLYIYKAYKSGSGAKPDFAAQPEVNAYRGDKAILYRVFVDGPVKCMDVLFPYDNSGEARSSNLFYVKQSDLYVTPFKPRIAR